MIIHFVGICMFDPTRQPVQAFLPNVRTGLPDHPNARPHEAFIAVPPDSVDHTGWGDPIVRRVAALGSEIYWTFPLDGVDIELDPPPDAGGDINVGVLRRMLDVAVENCPTKTKLRDDLDQPTSSLLAGRVFIRGGPLNSVNADTMAPPPDNQISFTNLDVEDNLTITATRFAADGGGGARVLRMNSPAPVAIAICNVDQTPPVDDDRADLALYCALMKEDQAPAAKEGVGAVRRPGRPAGQFPITIGPGCSNTQWP